MSSSSQEHSSLHSGPSVPGLHSPLSPQGLGVSRWRGATRWWCCAACSGRASPSTTLPAARTMATFTWARVRRIWTYPSCYRRGSLNIISIKLDILGLFVLSWFWSFCSPSRDTGPESRSALPRRHYVETGRTAAEGMVRCLLSFLDSTESYLWVRPPLECDAYWPRMGTCVCTWTHSSRGQGHPGMSSFAF